jgi:hypothetical protein
MPRLRDCDLELLDVVEALTTEKSVDIETLGLDPDELPELKNTLRCLRKPHKPPSLSKIIEQAAKAAKKTGEPLTSVTLPDGTRLDFTKTEQQGNAVDQWFAKHADKTQGH